MEEKQKSNWWQALSLLGQLGYVIAIPLVLLALLGRFLDKQYNSSPWFLIAAMFLSLAISTTWVYRKTMQIMGEATKEDKEKNEREKKSL